MDYKQVIVVRTDVKMSRGKIAAQVAHASLSAAIKAMKERPEWFNVWLNSGQKKVVLQVRSEEELVKLYEKAIELGLPVSLIEDMGLTEIPPGTKTAIGIGPAPSIEVDKVTGKLRLLK